MKEKADKLPENFCLVRIPRHDDQRGTLCFAEWHHLPFVPKRVFWISGIPAGALRGGHSHSTCAEVVFAVSGSFDMTVDTGRQRQTFHMDSPDTGIYIGPNVWCELSGFAPGTACAVVASEEYDPKGYINSYEEFCRRKSDK